MAHRLWLREHARTYPDPDRVTIDIEAALARFPSLRPRSDLYTYDDGRAHLLLCLSGLLPIAFRGASYNIPIALWLPRDYPRHPPIPYVVPTADILVRPSVHVDPSGRCTVPYLVDWAAKPEPCNLVDLLQAMQHLFSRVPPLYAKSSPRHDDDRPPLPPKPISPRPQTDPSNRPSPPPPRAPARPPQYQSPPSDGNISPTPPNYRTQSVLPAQHLLDDDSHTQPPPAVAPPRPPNPELLQLHAQVHDKIRSEFSSLQQLLLPETDRLRAQQSDLLAGEPAIRDEMARLDAVSDVCRNVAARLRTNVELAQRNLSELRRKGDPDVDELLCSTAIVHNQLFNLVAEDNAIEDTIYHLHRALNAGRIDLERFLRTTRVLAEEQFMKRALIDKIQEGLPIGVALPYS